MRHILVPPSIPGLARGVAEPAAPAVLIAPAGGVEGGAPGPVGTAPRTVAIAAIAVAAEKEDLAAVGASADHEPERVHRSSRTLRKGMDTREEICELWSLGPAESRSPRFGPRVRRGRALRALTLSAPWWNGLTLRQPAEATGLSPFAVRCPESRAFWWSATRKGLAPMAGVFGCRGVQPEGLGDRHLDRGRRQDASLEHLDRGHWINRLLAGRCPRLTARSAAPARATGRRPSARGSAGRRDRSCRRRSLT